MRQTLSLLAAAALAVAPTVLAGHFTVPLERRSRALSARGQKGDDAVGTIYNGTDWVTSVNLGGQDLVVQIDTGSADLYVWFPFC